MRPDDHRNAAHRGPCPVLAGLAAAPPEGPQPG